MGRQGFLGVSCALALLCAPPHLALAQEGAPEAASAAPSSGVSAEYERAIAGALEEYRLQHYDEARSLFERAHALDPNARTLRGLGMVEFERRRYVRASELLEASLASTTKPLTEEQRVAVRELLARCRQFIATYVVEVSPARSDLTYELDGEPVTLGEGRVLAVATGEHVLRVHAPGEVMVERRLDARGGQSETLQVVLPLPAVEAEAQPVGAPLEEPTRPRSKLGIALTSVGGALLVGGGVSGTLALLEARDASRHSPEGDRAHRLGVITDVTLAVGAATALTGIVLLVKRHRAGRDRRATAASLFVPGLRF